MEMNIEERIYFNNMTNYKLRGIKNIKYPEVLNNLSQLSYAIRTIARDALSEQISQKNAKKEISDLLDNIKRIKKSIK